MSIEVNDDDDNTEEKEEEDDDCLEKIYFLKIIYFSKFDCVGLW